MDIQQIKVNTSHCSVSVTFPCRVQLHWELLKPKTPNQHDVFAVHMRDRLGNEMKAITSP